MTDEAGSTGSVDYWNRQFRTGPYETTPPEPVSAGDDATDSGGGARRRKRPEASSNEFTGSPVPLQIRVPSDLVQSLRLLAIDQDRTVSEIVLEAITTGQRVDKAWVARRKTG